MRVIVISNFIATSWNTNLLLFCYLQRELAGMRKEPWGFCLSPAQNLQAMLSSWIPWISIQQTRCFSALMHVSFVQFKSPRPLQSQSCISTDQFPTKESEEQRSCFAIKVKEANPLQPDKIITARVYLKCDFNVPLRIVSVWFSLMSFSLLPAED